MAVTRLVAAWRRWVHRHFHRDGILTWHYAVPDRPGYVHLTPPDDPQRSITVLYVRCAAPDCPFHSPGIITGEIAARYVVPSRQPFWWRRYRRTVYAQQGPTRAQAERQARQQRPAVVQQLRRIK